MTGYEVYHHASAMLGVDDGAFSSECESFAEDAIIFINRILHDLGCQEIESPTDEIKLNGKMTEALLFGVTMMTAFSISDLTKAGEFEGRYRKKRAEALSNLSMVSDVFPTPEGE